MVFGQIIPEQNFVGINCQKWGARADNREPERERMAPKGPIPASSNNFWKLSCENAVKALTLSAFHRELLSYLLGEIGRSAPISPRSGSLFIGASQAI